MFILLFVLNANAHLLDILPLIKTQLTIILFLTETDWLMPVYIQIKEKNIGIIGVEYHTRI